MLILVVDDEATDCQAMTDPLVREGFQVLKAADAPAALLVASRNPNIDLLISDISLPGMNGCELARQMIGSKPDLKVMFVSGFVGAEVCHYYGVPVTDLYFLRKPFTPQEFVTRVRRVLASNDRVQLSVPVSGASGGAC